MEPTEKPSHELAELRGQIDALDERIIALISERGRVAAEIGKLKAAAGTPVYAPDRESEVLARLRQLLASGGQREVRRAGRKLHRQGHRGHARHVRQHAGADLCRDSAADSPDHDHVPPEPVP